jgi:hypothetical protein
MDRTLGKLPVFELDRCKVIVPSVQAANGRHRCLLRHNSLLLISAKKTHRDFKLASLLIVLQFKINLLMRLVQTKL